MLRAPPFDWCNEAVDFAEPDEDGKGLSLPSTLPAWHCARALKKWS